MIGENKKGADQPQRKPVSAEVANYAERLANRAQQLAERVNGKLHSVMTSEGPRPDELPCKDPVEYPPLFSDMRGNLNGISNALDSIEDAMSRTEL